MSNERDIWVYTPARYQSDSRPNALLVLFDGLANIQLLSVPVILDNLIEASRIPATVAVFVSHPGGSRMQELDGNPKFGEFLATELLPWLRARYNVTMDPRETIVGGQSAGGFGAAYVALHHSSVFGAVLSQSAPFWGSPELGRELAERTPASDRNDDRHVREEMEDRAVLEGNWLQKLFISRNRLPLTFYLNAGSFEAQFWGGPGGVNGTLESNRHMRDVLLAKRLRSSLSGICWRPRLFELARPARGRPDRVDWKELMRIVNRRSEDEENSVDEKTPDLLTSC